MQLLLNIVTHHNIEHPLHHCILLCFTGIASLSSVMERVCQLSEEVPLRDEPRADGSKGSKRTPSTQRSIIFQCMSFVSNFSSTFRCWQWHECLIEQIASPTRGIVNANISRSRQPRRGRINSIAGDNNSSNVTEDLMGQPFHPEVIPLPSAGSIESNNEAGNGSGNLPRLRRDNADPMSPRIGRGSNAQENLSSNSSSGTYQNATYPSYRGTTAAGRRIAHSLCIALRQFFRAHLALIANVVRRRMRHRRNRLRSRASVAIAKVAPGFADHDWTLGAQGRRKKLFRTGQLKLMTKPQNEMWL